MALSAFEDDRSTPHQAAPGGDTGALREELRRERDRALRALADLANVRRHAEQDGDRRAEAGVRAIFLPLLSILDDLERALPWANADDQPLIEGLRNIQRKLLALLAVHGVTPFVSVNTPFDHNLHDAVAVVAHPSGPSGVVRDELRCGYLWNGIVLRPAQVRVAG